MNITPMRADETRVHFANMIGGFDLERTFYRNPRADVSAKQAAEFIAQACNAHDALVATLRQIASGNYAQADEVAHDALAAAGIAP